MKAALHGLETIEEWHWGDVTCSEQDRGAVQLGDSMTEKRRVTVDGEEYDVEMEFDGEKWEVSVGGRTFTIKSNLSSNAPHRKKDSSSKRVGSSGAVSSASPGKIVSILVSEGDKVGEGEVVIVLEAMKMQNEIKATTEGIVKKVYYQSGERVEANVPLLEVESLSKGDE